MFEQVGFVQKMKKWKVLASKKQNAECIFGHGTHSSRCVAATVECSVRTLPCSTTVNPWDFSVCQSKKWEKRSNSNAEHGHWSHLCAFERERERKRERLMCWVWLRRMERGMRMGGYLWSGRGFGEAI